MEILFSKQSRKHNLQPFSWGNDNPLPSLVTSEIPMRIFLVSLPSQISLILPARSRCQTPPSCPSPLGQCSGWLRGAVKLFGPVPGSNNSSGKLFALAVPFQVVWRNGAKTQQTEVQSIEARNRNKVELTAMTEHRKGCTGLSAHRAKRAVIFVPGAAGFACESP